MMCTNLRITAPIITPFGLPRAASRAATVWNTSLHRIAVIAGQNSAARTRAAFLSEPSHRIQFVYVPKYTSWLNQIEIWFSILVRRVLKRGNFSSVEALRERILAFIACVNQTAKPFRWTYAARPLTI